MELGAYRYVIALAAASLAVFALERVRPWRTGQRALRPALLSDLAHLVWNGHFLGVVLAGLATTWVLPALDALGPAPGFSSSVSVGVARAWPLAVQIPVALLVIDFMQWGVHVLLHRVPALWRFHQTHHSVVDGEMDFLASFRFQWAEVVVYRTLLYVPMALLGFSSDALFVHAVVGTVVGHLNHANLDLGHGAWRYVLNNPRMHLWHHAYDADAKTTVNFGIIFSLWDWLFGTAKVPAAPPPRIGFRGVEEFPRDLLSQSAWPLSAFGRRGTAASRVVGLAVLSALVYFSLPVSRTLLGGAP